MPELATRDQAAIRDIPRTCTCDWDMVRHFAAKPDRGVYPLLTRWERTRPDPDCIWHKRETIQ